MCYREKKQKNSSDSIKQRCFHSSLQRSRLRAPVSCRVFKLYYVPCSTQNAADGPNLGGAWVGVALGKVFAGERSEFATDDVGGEARAEEATVEGGELFLVDELSGAGVCGRGAAEGAQLAFDALADKRGFVGLLRGFFEGGFDVAVGDAAGAEIPSDAKLALFADLGALAHEKLGVACVIEQAGAFQMLYHVFHQRGVFAAALERLCHFMDGVRAACEDPDGGIVEGGFGFELARFGEHEKEDEVRT